MGSVSVSRRIGLPCQARRAWRRACAARLRHSCLCLNGSSCLNTAMASQDNDTQLALLALLAYEERLARWRMFPQHSRAEFVEQLSTLMTKVALAEREDERKGEDLSASS